MTNVRPVEYRPATPGQTLEITTSKALMARYDIEALVPYRRLTFHVVQLALSAGTHDVDFRPVRLERGSLLHLRPGQAHRWSLAGSDTRIAFFTDGPWAEPLGRAGSTAAVDLSSTTFDAIGLTLDFVQQRLRAEPDRRVVAGLRDLLIAEVAACAQPSSVGPPAYLALIERLEAGHLDRSIGRHAAAIGYSERTITRACQEAVGMTAKELVDQRVALEARRRLTDDGVTAAAVAHELGFSEATNFVKFFRRLVGLSPTEWQAGLRSSSA
ncbi:MAG: helix-turn-helix transcriptional regulator [Actinomycetota bacterium]